MPVKPLPAPGTPLKSSVLPTNIAADPAQPLSLVAFFHLCRGFFRAKLNNKDAIISFGLVTPSIIAVGIFIYGFITWTLRVSLSAWKGLLPDFTWVGQKNYVELFSDPRFLIDLRNTAIFTFVFVAGALLLGFALALLLDQNLPGENFFRSLFLFPMAISYIVTGVVWRWLMNPAEGTRISGLNQVFAYFGWDWLISRWHTTPIWGIAAISLAAIWQMSGFTMALYLGGLRSISDEVREAARVDGATEWQLYRHIIIPMLNPVTLSAVIILGHISLKVFDLIIALAGKQLALDVPAIYMWQATFDGYFFGRGAAISILLLLIISILIIPYILYNLRHEADV
ncbi:MAG TPA: sugar ABC transporter permease [Anaerolineales bacterium]|jgi:glucose/mannose transport system permease protein